MIMEAISALGGSGDKNGVTRLAISKFIESSHPEDLHPAHASILAVNLANMTDSGELVLVNDGYFRAGPGSPVPKRSRGRPPKPRITGTLVASSCSASIGGSGDGMMMPKRRGRPPKPVDPLAPVKVPRPRGRPPKNPAEGGAAGEAKRPRGRPPKVTPQFAEIGFV